ncbi:MAG TPA: hypothetical protein VGM23_14865 [Armatimonadota bacterium]
MADNTAMNDMPAPQLLSRWYLMFLGFILVIFGIAGLVAARGVPTGATTLVTVSIIWLVTAIVSLSVAFAVTSTRTVRDTAGVIGALYLAWGIVALFSSSALATVSAAATVAGASGLLILLGAIGLAASLVPAGWLARTPATVSSNAT